MGIPLTMRLARLNFQPCLLISPKSPATMEAQSRKTERKLRSGNRVSITFTKMDAQRQMTHTATTEVGQAVGLQQRTQCQLACSTMEEVLSSSRGTTTSASSRKCLEAAPSTARTLF